MNMSESIKELAGALAKAQAEMKNPSFDAKNPHFNNRFASLPAVREATVPVLNKHGIAVTQLLAGNDSGLICETILMHSSGEWISGSFWMPVVKRDPQGYGSAATYARRYSLQAVCGVVGDEDDDGNEASKAPKVTPRAGAYDELPTDMQIAITDHANEVRQLLHRNDDAGAYAHLQEFDHGDDAQVKAALWDRFDSKERSRLTKAAPKKERASAVTQ